MKTYTSCTPLGQKKEDDRYLRGLEKSPTSNCIYLPSSGPWQLPIKQLHQLFSLTLILTSKTYVSDLCRVACPLRKKEKREVGGVNLESLRL